MEIKFIGQGFEAKTRSSVGKELIELFANKNFHSFTGITAFTSQAGIRGLSRHIEAAKGHLKNITIITGVDQKGTSKEALDELLSLSIQTFVFYQPSTPIFHPKIYLFEGTEKSELIIGSSNLTLQGLFTNIETSILISIENNAIADISVIDQLKNYFKGIFNSKDPNLKRIDPDLIANLVNAKIVPMEAERKTEQTKTDESNTNEAELIISKIFPKRAIARIPIDFINRNKKKRSNQASRRKLDTGELVWTRKKLPSSSVQGSHQGTNPTGGLRLVQDNFMYEGKKIDQTSYFKNIFKRYSWKQVRETPYVEATLVPFKIVIKGIFHGIYKLEIRHKPSGESGQHNYTTSISWGVISNLIRDSNLTGSRLDLYAPKKNGSPFLIVIS